MQWATPDEEARPADFSTLLKDAPTRSIVSLEEIMPQQHTNKKSHEAGQESGEKNNNASKRELFLLARTPLAPQNF